jgi:hypothetical protein
VDTILCWKFDRLSRQGIPFLAGVFGLLDRAGAALVTKVEPWLDTATPMGRAMCGIVAEMARAESEANSERGKLRHASEARAGRLHTGGPRPYGYAFDGSLVPGEAAVVREVAGRVLDGESLRRVALDLNGRGVPTSNGGEWHSRTLKVMLSSPRHAGIRTHNGDVYQGSWEPTLDRETHDAVLAALSRPLAERRQARRHLLVGVARCGACAGAMRHTASMARGRRVDRYRCAGAEGGCGRVSAHMAPLDALVEREVLDWLAGMRVRPHQGTDRALLERALDDDRAALRDLVRARFVLRVLDDDAFVPAREELDARVETNRRLLAASGRARSEDLAGSLPLGDRAALQAWWDGASLDDRSDAVRWAVREVAVSPAGRRTRGFDESRVRVEVSFPAALEAARFPGGSAAR